MCSCLIADGLSDRIMITASCVSGEAETNTSLLNLAYFYNQTYVVQSIGMKLLEKQRRAKVIKNAFTLVPKSTKPGDDTLTALPKSIEKEKHLIPTGYQIVGDNLYLHINARHE